MDSYLMVLLSWPRFMLRRYIRLFAFIAVIIIKSIFCWKDLGKLVIRVGERFGNWLGTGKRPFF